MKIKDIPRQERPRERFILYGKEALSNEELIAIVLKTGIKERSVKELALEVLKLLEKYTLDNLSIQKLKEIKGIGDVKAIEFLAALELFRRLSLKEEQVLRKIKTSSDAFNYIKPFLVDDKQERFYVIYLNSQNEIIQHKLLFQGTLDQSIVHPREIFKYAYLLSANSIICLHTHPSGNLKPSEADKRFVKALDEISKLQGITILDHLIVSLNNHQSIPLLLD